MKKQLVISTSIDLVCIAPERIVYISSDGNYSTLVQTDNEARMLSYQLGQIEKMISSQLGNEGNISDYPFMHLLYSQLLVCQRVCLQNTVCLICK